MNQIIGIIKLLGVLIFSIGIVVAVYTSIQIHKSDTEVIAMTILCLLGAVYVYYLLRTGIWNTKNIFYRMNIFLWLGFLFHMVFVFFAFYWGISRGLSFFLTVLPLGIFGIVIGIYDFTILLKRRRIKGS